ncbi:MAG TPA: MoxR family ATPase [Nitrososphaeraceae archaeon]
MTEVTHVQLSSILKHYYRQRIPVFVWGTLGIGKSSIIKQVAKDLSVEFGQGFIEGEPDGEEKFGFIDVRISQLEPSDLRGLPNIINDDNTKVTKWIIPNWLPRNEKSKGILFFDELNLAPPSIQASCYQLILDRRLGDYKLPDGWFIISAGNTINDKANVFDLPSPLANRFTHLNLKIPSKDEWVNWGMNNNINSWILGFMEFKPSFLYKFDKSNKDKAFPTPRSWEYVSKLLANSDKMNLEDKNILVASAVGDGVATEFIAYYRLQNKINLKEILENPESVKEIKEIDLRYSLLSAVTEKYREDKKVLEKVLKVCEYLEPEFAILLLRYMKASRNEFVNEVLKVKIGKEIINKYAKYLTELKND